MAKREKLQRKNADLDKIWAKEQVVQRLGYLLKKSRKENGFTSFQHFAEDLGIARSLYAKYEKGAVMNITTLIRIIQGMGLKVSDFFKDFD